MPPSGKRPSNGDVDLGTGIYLIAGVHASAGPSDAGSATEGFSTSVRDSWTVGCLVGAGATEEDDNSTAEEYSTLIDEEDSAALDNGFAEDEAGTAELEAGSTTLEESSTALEAIATDDDDITADETATVG